MREPGLLVGGLFLALSAYAALAVIGGGLFLAHRRAVREEVERLLRSVEKEPMRKRAGKAVGRDAEGAAGGSVGRRDR